MIDFIMKKDKDGVILRANSNAAKDWCVEHLQQMADPVYPEYYADAARILFERQGFEVADRRNVTDLGKRSSLDELL